MCRHRVMNIFFIPCADFVFSPHPFFAKKHPFCTMIALERVRNLCVKKLGHKDSRLMLADTLSIRIANKKRKNG